MFENMTQRERILAVLLSALVPISLSFLAVFWFIQKYGDNNSQIVQLLDRIGNEENKIALARKAQKRLHYYQTLSLPQDFRSSTADYQQWLRDLGRNSGLKGNSISPKVGQTIRYRNKEIGKSQVLQFVSEGGLDEIISFLYQFYSLDTLHRVQSLRITPVTAMARGTRVLTGTMKLAMDVELVVLNEAKDEFNFSTAVRALPKSMEELQAAIVNRNIFGPPNNTPLVRVSPSSSYASNTEVKVTVRGDDADKDDTLQFELLESEIEGAVLEPRPGSREATLILPPTPQGTYEFKVGVKDSGFPPKESDSSFKIVLRDPPNSKPSIVAKLSNPYSPDRPIEVVLEGSDRDANDILAFTIAEGVEGAEIVQENETDRNPVLYIPPQDIGVYPFRVTVSDGREGEEEKLVDRTFDVIVERLFSHLMETRITSIVRERSGEWFVNVRVRTMGKSFYLGVGDSFEIEKQTWIVREILPNQVVFQVGDQLKTFEPRVPFTSPLHSESLASEPIPDSVSITEVKPVQTGTIRED
jgi:hypothetical protein